MADRQPRRLTCRFTVRWKGQPRAACPHAAIGGKKYAGSELLTRRTVESVPTVADASVLEVSKEELKASILLFYSLLDEQQRRLYAGLESLKLGRGRPPARWASRLRDAKRGEKLQRPAASVGNPR